LVRSGGAVGQEDRTKVGSYRPGDTAVAGWNSTQVLNDLIPKLPKDKIEGKTVAWSTGVSNEPDAAAVQKAIAENVPLQIAELKKQNAKNIVIMGVGPAEKLKGANEALAKVAANNGVLFAGPQRSPNPGDPEHLHSNNQPAEMAAVREALAKAPTSGGTQAPTATGGIPASPLAGQVARINASSASPEVKEAAIAELHRQHTALSMGQDENKYELTRAIVRNDPTVTPDYINTLVKTNRISPGAGTEALADLQKVQVARQKLADGITLVNAAGAGGAPLDPKNEVHKKALDAHYGLASQLWPANETLPRAIDYSIKYGMVPDPVKSVIRGALHSARPDLAVRAVETINTLRNANPQLVADIGDENDLRLATLIGTYSSAGMAPDKAVELATESLKVNKADREARAADYDLQRGKEAKDRTASDDKWIASQQNSLWVRDPDVDPMMRTEFAETAKVEFQRTGNLEASRRMALDTINRVWGRSDVGGDRRYVKFAPEKFYGIPSLTPAENSRWMNEQLISDVSKGALQDPANPITSNRLRLIPDPTRSNGGNPVYQVWMVQPDASWQQVIDAKGTPVRWMPNYSTSADSKRRNDAVAADIEKARTLRREQGERERMVPERP
jgi:hypothetical protein